MYKAWRSVPSSNVEVLTDAHAYNKDKNLSAREIEHRISEYEGYLDHQKRILNIIPLRLADENNLKRREYIRKNIDQYTKWISHYKSELESA